MNNSVPLYTTLQLLHKNSKKSQEQKLEKCKNVYKAMFQTRIHFFQNPHPLITVKDIASWGIWI